MRSCWKLLGIGFLLAVAVIVASDAVQARTHWSHRTCLSAAVAGAVLALAAFAKVRHAARSGGAR